MTTLNTIIEEEKKEFIEKGADIEHERWSKWQSYFFSKCEISSPEDGYVYLQLPADLYERWKRQIETAYSELSEAEKESDRREVRSYDALLTTAMQRAYEAGRADWLRSEIEKLEREIAIHKQLASEWTGIDLKNYTLHRINPHKEQVDAFTSIITRYKEELKVLESK